MPESRSAQYEATIEHGFGASDIRPSPATTVPSTPPDAKFARAQLVWVEEQVQNSLEADLGGAYPPTSEAVEDALSMYAFLGGAQMPPPAHPALPLVVEDEALTPTESTTLRRVRETSLRI